MVVGISRQEQDAAGAALQERSLLSKDMRH